MLRALPVLILAAAAGWAQPAPPAPPRVAGIVRAGSQPVPGATVRAAQGEARLVTTTGDDGRYEFDKLTPGPCKLEVEMFGFAPSRRETVIGQTNATQDWALEMKPFVPPAPAGPSRQPGGFPGRRPGFQNLTLNQNAESQQQLQAAIESAPAPESQPDAANANEAFLVNGSLSTGLQQAQQQDLMEGRRGEFMQMGGMMPGQDGPPGMGGMTPGGPGGPGGGRPGGGMGGGGGGGGFGGRGGFGGGPGGRMGGPGGRMRGPRDAASFGNRARRGSQGIHGAAFFSLDNSALDARPYSLTGQTVEKPSYAQSRFGITAGGPLVIPKLIKSDRTFFFLNFSGTRARNPFQSTSTLPTPAERAGDFSQAVASGPVQIFDPASHLPFPGNAIPASRFNPAAAGLLSFIPLPNQTGSVQNYQYVTSVASNANNLGLRLNRSITDRDRLDFNLNLQSRNSTNAQLYGFRDPGDGLGTSISAGWSHTLPHHLISSFRVNFSRNRTETTPFFAYGPNVAALLGINGVSNNPINYGPPNLSFTNFGGLTDASALVGRNQTTGFTESLAILRNTHNITVGGGYRRMQINNRTDQNARGTFTFSGIGTSAFDAQNQPLSGTGFDFADFLLGLPQSSSVRFGDTSTYFRASAYNGFAMDDWRARSNLTLNIGLRYEFFTPYNEKYNHISNLDVAPGFTGVAVVTPGQAGPYSGVFPSGLINPDKNNFSPRLGIAWKPFPKHQFQLRAGYGLFHNGSIYNQFPSRLAAQPPWADTAAVNTSTAVPLTLQNGFATAPTQTITNTYAVDRNYKPGYAQTWNFSIQQSLPRQLVMELGYLGTKGTGLDIQTLPNRATPGSPLTAEQRRQIGNAVGFTFDTSQGNSIYHAAHVRFTRRFSRGISVNALYTFSKSIDNASTIGGGGATVAQNNLDLRAERGLSSFNQTHVFSTNFILTSPVAESGGLIRGSGWKLRMLKDWTVSGGLSASSGSPLTARVLGNQSDTGGTGSVGSGRAQATGAPLYSGSGFFNLAAFTIPLAGTFGDAGRNTIIGPARASLNLALGRSFNFDERRRIELRFETQNLTNHVGYSGLGTVVNSSTYGLPTSTASMRTVQLVLRFRF